ncbi:DoxX family protein [Nonomuraea thailandensis]|nr:DoxX family protein [Nonomuraea thailandensis]
MFGIAGVMKATQPKDELAARLPWAEDFSAGTVRLIGVAELAGALGLTLPALTGIAPILTPPAALTHARRREPSAIAFNAVLFVLAAFVAWARLGPYGF